jgi:hypothetical protein
MIQSRPLEIDQVFQALAQRLMTGVGAIKSRYNLSFFTFNIEFLPATNSAFTTGNFIVQNDSAFVLTRTSYIAVLATDNKTPVNAVTVPAPATTLNILGLSAPFLCNIVDSGSGRQFSNIDTHIDNWFGSAQRPYFWPAPQVLDPNSNVTMRIQNLDTINYNVRCAFHGFKVFGDVAAFKVAKAI